MNKPIYIPTVTVYNPKVDLHLCSPTEQRCLLRANKTTLVDCFTFGLKMNKGRIDPYKHYNWYIDFVTEYQNEDDLYFIAPDWDWLDDISLLCDRWLRQVERAKCLVVPKTFLANKLERIYGFALQRHQNKAHPKWTHSFSKMYKTQLDSPTELWTYDSMCKPC